MLGKLINTVVCTMAEASVGGISTLFLNKRKEQKREKAKIYEERPELQITEYKEYLG